VGKIVELARTAELFEHPLHPYSEALISALPQPDPRKKRDRILLIGDVANPANPPSGCYFHPRCRYIQGICKTDPPLWGEVSSGHFVACHFAGKISLRPLQAPNRSLRFNA